MLFFFKNTQDPLCFKKFSRKKYAAFSSLGKLVKISTLGAACTLIASPVQGQSKQDNDSVSKKLDLEEVEVVGQKSTVLIDEVPRMVELISAETIESSPSQSVQDLIQYQSNIDIRQRGQLGIQSDISIRGGSFDQVLILLNGVNISDPQTGHHSLNLPLDPETVSKIEVLNGPSARANGANAFSGAINFITKPQNINEINASAHFGQYGYLKTHLGFNLAGKNSKHLISVGRSKSDGYIDNTDFDATNVFYHGNYNIDKHTTAHAQVGYNQKAFGAEGYYSAKYPENFEETSSIFFVAGIKSGTKVKFKSDIFWRRHYDMFELNRIGGDYYKYEKDTLISNDLSNTVYDSIFRYVNHHITDIFGTNANLTFKNALGKTTLGVGLRSDNIISSSMGDELSTPIDVKNSDGDQYKYGDSRNNFDIYAEHVYKNRYIFASAGALLNWNSFDAQKLNVIPGIDVGINLTSHISALASYNYTIGQPTFTDLYYYDPTNEGNRELKSYYQHSIEGGLKYSSNGITAKAIAFYTNGENTIEWALNNSTNSFKPINVELSENLGTEISLNYKSKNETVFEKLVSRLYIGYTYIDTYRNTNDSTSKYSNLRQKLAVNLQQKLTEDITLAWNFMYKERTGNYLVYNFEDNEYSFNGFTSTFLLDARLTYRIQDFKIYIEGSNLLDKEYYESGSAPQPGRWIKGGISYKFGW